MYEKREIYRAIAEIAYTIARAGDGLQSIERDKFFTIIHKELDYESWAAESRFDLLEKLHPDPQSAFDYAISELKKYKDHLTPELKEKTLLIAREVAEAYHNKNSDEQQYLKRLKNCLYNE